MRIYILDFGFGSSFVFLLRNLLLYLFCGVLGPKPLSKNLHRGLGVRCFPFIYLTCKCNLYKHIVSHDSSLTFPVDVLPSFTFNKRLSLIIDFINFLRMFSGGGFFRCCCFCKFTRSLNSFAKRFLNRHRLFVYFSTSRRN